MTLTKILSNIDVHATVCIIDSCALSTS